MNNFIFNLSSYSLLFNDTVQSRVNQSLYQFILSCSVPILYIQINTYPVLFLPYIINAVKAEEEK